MYACTIGADIDRTMPLWQPRSAIKREPEPQVKASAEPTQAQGPGQRKAGQKLRSDERPDPLAELAKHIGAPELD